MDRVKSSARVLRRITVVAEVVMVVLLGGFVVTQLMVLVLAPAARETWSLGGMELVWSLGDSFRDARRLSLTLAVTVVYLFGTRSFVALMRMWEAGDVFTTSSINLVRRLGTLLVVAVLVRTLGTEGPFVLDVDLLQVLFGLFLNLLGWVLNAAREATDELADVV
jgi:hypothetical protein